MTASRLAPLIVAVGLVLAGAAGAAERVALVVGNGAYEHLPVLRTPATDARDIATALREIGFEVVAREDADHAGLRNAVFEFRRKVADASLVLVYYSGHALQVEETSYLVPVDAQLSERADIPWQALDLSTLLRTVVGDRRPVLLFLDAARDDSFAKKLGAESASHSTRAVVASAVENTLLAFSAMPGTKAVEGSGRNSPYTEALLKHLRAPGLEVRQLLTRVRKAVVDLTAGGQVPWDNSSLNGDVYLVPLPDTGKPAGEAVSEFETVFWTSTEHLDSKAAYEAYLARFGPNGGFAPIARERIKALEAEAGKR